MDQRTTGLLTGSAPEGLQPVATELRLVFMRLDLLARRQRTVFRLTPSQTSMLDTLARHGRVRMSELAALENVRVPTASNAVSSLEDEGLVTRIPDESDRRVVCVELTEAGRTAVAETLRDRDAAIAAVLADLPVAQRLSLEEALPAINALVDRLETDTAVDAE